MDHGLRRPGQTREAEFSYAAAFNRGVSDGTRTRDRRDHNPELYQLSYAHRAAGESSSGGWRSGRGS